MLPEEEEGSYLKHRYVSMKTNNVRCRWHENFTVEAIIKIGLKSLSIMIVFLKRLGNTDIDTAFAALYCSVLPPIWQFLLDL